MGSKYFTIRPQNISSSLLGNLPCEVITRLKDKYFSQKTSEKKSTVDFINNLNKMTSTVGFYPYEYLDPSSLDKSRFNYLNLDRDNFLFSSHYIDDYFLSRNAICPDFKKKEVIDKEDVMLSLNHGVELTEPQKITNNFKKILMLVRIKRIYVDFFNEEFVNYMLELYDEFFPQD